MAAPRHLRSRRLVAPLALLLGALSVACETAPFVADEVPCRCDVETCGPTTCGYELTLHANCRDDVALVEVVIDGHLEAQALRPGQPVTPCTRVEPGETGQLLARGGKWIWGPILSPCDEPGAVHSLVLECAAATP